MPPRHLVLHLAHSRLFPLIPPCASSDLARMASYASRVDLRSHRAAMTALFRSRILGTAFPTRLKMYAMPRMRSRRGGDGIFLERVIFSPVPIACRFAGDGPHRQGRTPGPSRHEGQHSVIRRVHQSARQIDRVLA